MPEAAQRSIGLLGATGIGVGAIVGGGILALSGTAFALTGPSAALAFALNGIIALITALSFAELATAFPQSGGSYVFAKRVLSVGAAFAVGWVVWFASIVAAALYAAGFAAYALEGARGLLGDHAPEWLSQHWLIPLLAIMTTAICALIMIRTSGGSGLLINIGKVIVFGLLIGGGLYVCLRDQPPAAQQLTPFLGNGMLGLIQAMGATFIALQGFDLIAAVAGEIKEPRQVIPRAILYSLGIALLVYLPFLILIPVVGIAPGESIQTASADAPDTIIAIAADYYLGRFGYWLVIIAGVLSMASALLANIFAAARIAHAMARDRTLVVALDRVHTVYATPWIAILVTSGIIMFILLAIGDVAAAGAASSLIFLLAFALTHVLCLVTRSRKPDHDGFRMPWWPWLPAVGATLCAALALYQAVTVPAAGTVTLCWLIIGVTSYVWRFGRRAKIFDAASEASDPDLLELRGRSPLVLVPVADSGNAASLAAMASCIAAPRVGRVLLLNVVRPPKEAEALDDVLTDSTTALRDSMAVSLRHGVRCEAMTTVNPSVWEEIARVATTHRCASVMLGLRRLTDDGVLGNLDALTRRLDTNLLFVRTTDNWDPANLQRVLIPIGGHSVHVALRARLLAGLHRRSENGIHITYLLVDKEAATQTTMLRRKSFQSQLIVDETNLPYDINVIATDDIVSAISDAAVNHDLLIMGLGNAQAGKPAIGSVVREVLERVDKPIMLLGAHN